MIRIAEHAGIIKKWTPSTHDLYLINDHHIMFRSLGMERKNFKGMHLCQFFIDDPDVNKNQDTISFLYSRLRNPPHVTTDSKGEPVRFQSIITANWEGRNWLWKNYMRDPKTGGNKAEGGDGHDTVLIPDPNKPGKTKPVYSGKAYWMCPTGDNKMLPENYITDLAVSHSQEWMDRYVYCLDVAKHSGLIYYDFNAAVHHKSADEVADIEGLNHILAIDVGGTHATAVMHMASDGKNVYVYDEWYKKNCTISQLGGYLQKMKQRGIYRRMIIDPTSAKGEMTSKSSIKKELQVKFRLSFTNGDNSVDVGIRKIQDALAPSMGDPFFYVDTVRCPNLRREMEIYRRQESRLMDMDDMEYEERPVKKNDDCLDAIRYGFMYLSRQIRRSIEDTGERVFKRKRTQHRIDKLPFYKDHPQFANEKNLEATYRSLGLPAKKIRQLLAQK